MMDYRLPDIIHRGIMTTSIVGACVSFRIEWDFDGIRHVYCHKIAVHSFRYIGNKVVKGIVIENANKSIKEYLAKTPTHP